MIKRIAGLLAVGAVITAITITFLAAGEASAHQPSVDYSCKQVVIKLYDYKKGENKLWVKVNDIVVLSKSFSGLVTKYKILVKGGDKVEVDVNAWDDSDGNPSDGPSRHYPTKTIPSCPTTTTTTMNTVPSSIATSTTTSSAPTTTTTTQEEKKTVCINKIKTVEVTPEDENTIGEPYTLGACVSAPTPIRIQPQFTG